MRYYLLTTAKFANQCLEYLTFGSTQSNWLVNIEIGDIIFLSQFNSKSQQIYGPFRVDRILFYDKKIIYPEQKFYYRIEFQPHESKMINETDLYLQGINKHQIDYSLRVIGLLQQNKHLHAMSLTRKEGKFIAQTLQNIGVKIPKSKFGINPRSHDNNVDLKFLKEKNGILKNSFFKSEADLESYILLCLKQDRTIFNKFINEVIREKPDGPYEIYNQFIFHNAYPADIVLSNNNILNVIELKKDNLTKILLPQIEKEMEKHLFYSYLSNRLKNPKYKYFNFILVCQQNHENKKLKVALEKIFKNLSTKLPDNRNNSLLILEYYFKDGELLFDKIS